MTVQILALLIVVVGFSALIGWVYWPGNSQRFAAGSRLALDEAAAKPDRCPEQYPDQCPDQYRENDGEAPR